MKKKKLKKEKGKRKRDIEAAIAQPYSWATQCRFTHTAHDVFFLAKP